MCKNMYKRTNNPLVPKGIPAAQSERCPACPGMGFPALLQAFPEVFQLFWALGRGRGKEHLMLCITELQESLSEHGGERLNEDI